MVVAIAPKTVTVDPFTLEIISHRLHQITEEVGTTLERVGGTVNTTQKHDYMAALYRANGDVLHGTSAHAACAGFAVKHIIKLFADDDGINPGDVFLLNDPYVAAIHQSDVYVISPIHFEDRLVAWSGTFVHVADIGALSPGGNSPGATEVFHEGVRIPGIKLVDRGKVRRDVFDTITNMTRQPALVGLDLKCEIAANNVAHARMLEVYEQYGAEVVDAVSVEMMRYTEQVLRTRLQEIPDGSWQATGIIEASDTWNVVVTLTKTGDRILFDFTGTDPQAKVGINVPYHATYASCFGALSSILGWDLPKNHGAFRPIEVIAPPGTVANVQWPGPVSLSTTSGRTVIGYVVGAALTQMVAGSEKWHLEAKSGRLGHRRARTAGVNQHGWYYVATLGGLDGGGARPVADGIDCGNGTDHNVEWFEANYPFLYLYRRAVKDGGGAGEFRGGAGQEVAVMIHDAPEERIRCVPFGIAGLRNSGQGLFGGYPGAPSTMVLAKDTNVQELFTRKMPPVDLATIGGESASVPYREWELHPNDVLSFCSSSGGGYGDPLDRDPTWVARDVFERVLSTEAARDIYGVITDGTNTDVEASEALRARLRRERMDDPERGSPSFSEADDGSPLKGNGQVGDADHPLRANLEVARNSGSAWVRCAKCKHPLSPVGKSWSEACTRKLLPPTKAGVLMAPLEGHFLLEQHCCPSCGVLLETAMVEAAQ
jgi:N-methylhydantoinase B